jgi:hypothetical protein
MEDASQQGTGDPRPISMFTMAPFTPPSSISSLSTSSPQMSSPESSPAVQTPVCGSVLFGTNTSSIQGEDFSKLERELLTLAEEEMSTSFAPVEDPSKKSRERCIQNTARRTRKRKLTSTKQTSVQKALATAQPSHINEVSGSLSSCGTGACS